MVHCHYRRDRRPLGLSPGHLGSLAAPAEDDLRNPLTLVPNVPVHPVAFAIAEKLSRRGLKSRIHRRAYRNRELSNAQKAANKTRAKVPARVGHGFGHQKNNIGAEIVRTIGIVRARCRSVVATASKPS